MERKQAGMYQLSGPMETVVLTIGTDPDVTEELLNAVNNRAWSVSAFHFERYFTAPRRPSIGSYIGKSSGCLAFVDYDRSPEEAAETTRYLAQTFPGKVLTVAIGRRPTSTAILNAMRSGCSEFITKHAAQAVLDVVFDRFEESRFVTLESAQPSGSILAVLGAKGGVGATSVAVHLAAYLAERHGKRTLLIDGQQRLGHTCVYLGLDGTSYTFAEILRNLQRMDSELLHGFVAHHPSGLEVASSPDIASGDSIPSPQEMARTLDFLKGEYDYIVLDCDRMQASTMPCILDAATDLYLVTTPEVAPIRDLSRTVDSLTVAHQPIDKLKMVLNRYNMPHAIGQEQIEKALKIPVAARLPDHPADLLHAANTGKVTAHNSSNEFAAAVARWTDRIAGMSATAATRRKDHKLLSRWRQVIPAW